MQRTYATQLKSKFPTVALYLLAVVEVVHPCTALYASAFSASTMRRCDLCIQRQALMMQRHESGQVMTTQTIGLIRTVPSGELIHCLEQHSLMSRDHLVHIPHSTTSPCDHFYNPSLLSTSLIVRNLVLTPLSPPSAMVGTYHAKLTKSSLASTLPMSPYHPPMLPSYYHPSMLPPSPYSHMPPSPYTYDPYGPTYPPPSRYYPYEDYSYDPYDYDYRSQPYYQPYQPRHYQ